MTKEDLWATLDKTTFDFSPLHPDAAPLNVVGEVARFAGWLRAHSAQCVELGRPDWAHMVNRAAGLLEQRHPTPIPMDKLDRLIALDRDDPTGGSHD